MNREITCSISCDVLVVGGGGAGIRAALQAAEANVSVLLVSTTQIGRSGSTFYANSPEWGMMCATDDKDAALFYKEILSTCGGCVDPALVRLLAERSPTCLNQLERDGLSFLTLESIGLVGCFGKKSRGVLLRDMDQAISAFCARLAATSGLQVRSGLYVADLLMHDGVCAGAVAVDKTGGLVAIHAGAVVLACGGAQGLYRYSYANGAIHGAAYAMAARHGARLVNLEFVQFICAALSPSPGLNYYQFAFSEQPQVLNGQGEPFLPAYLPPGCPVEECLRLRAEHGPFSVNDDSKYFDLAMISETEKGHGLGAEIIPDASRIQGAKYSRWRGFLRSRGLDEATPMTIYPHAHAFNGGILLHSDVSTDIPGLYACGESAGGCHGPNRMGGNAILATQVFGMLAGQGAAAFAKANRLSRLEKPRLSDLFASSSKIALSPAQAMETVKDVMQRHGFLRRDETGLQQGLESLAELSVDLSGNGLTPAHFMAANALDAARLILTAMKERKESRGGHNRTDFPGTTADWGEMRFIGGSSNKEKRCAQ